MSETEWNPETDVFYLIIWTRDRRLTVACAQWFDIWDYTPASETRYQHKNKAYEDAVKLGAIHNVEVDVTDYFPILSLNEEPT